ncbi:hypothetical protein Y032_0026g1334 [Ancylostoma ceylanicum]|uniref:Uncharacterized protein n=1 Tax=Ancylostoma ceylanicum TaxID=53326 RepID=A0A016UW86_9BILA|nr:hypothetical protein Y032_0026g1334 [Ancylostoma ceylanicum]
MTVVGYVRTLVFFILLGLTMALPLLWLDAEGRVHQEPQIEYLRSFGPLSILKRNIAIGRGDGLRPGK